MEKLLLRISEAADAVGLGKTKFYELVQRGEIRSIHVGRVVRVPTEAIEEWIEAKLKEDADA
jgi:excisionase family DNA binding protein